MYFSEEDVREMQRREREEDERAYAAKARAEEWLNSTAEARRKELLEDPCPYTFAHTRHWCGHPRCRDA